MGNLFGVINYNNTTLLKSTTLETITKKCMINSEKFGKDATGICLLTDNNIKIYKDSVPATEFIKSYKYRTIIERSLIQHKIFSIIGHSRTKTKSSELHNENNHPIITNTVDGAHSGVITNDNKLFSKYRGSIERNGQTDSEIIFRLLEFNLRKNSITQSKKDNIVQAIKKTASELQGSFTCSFITSQNPRYVSIFKNYKYKLPIFVFNENKLIMFASRSKVITNIIGDQQLIKEVPKIINLTSGGVRIDVTNGEIYKFDLNN